MAKPPSREELSNRRRRREKEKTDKKYLLLQESRRDGEVEIDRERAFERTGERLSFPNCSIERGERNRWRTQKWGHRRQSGKGGAPGRCNSWYGVSVGPASYVAFFF